MENRNEERVKYLDSYTPQQLKLAEFIASYGYKCVQQVMLVSHHTITSTCSTHTPCLQGTRVVLSLTQQRVYLLGHDTNHSLNASLQYWSIICQSISSLLCHPTVSFNLLTCGFSISNGLPMLLSISRMFVLAFLALVCTSQSHAVYLVYSVQCNHGGWESADCGELQPLYSSTQLRDPAGVPGSSRLWMLELQLYRFVC